MLISRAIADLENCKNSHNVRLQQMNKYAKFDNVRLVNSRDHELSVIKNVCIGQPAHEKDAARCLCTLTD